MLHKFIQETEVIALFTQHKAVSTRVVARVNTNLGRTRVSFDFAHAHVCVHPSNFATLGKLRMRVKHKPGFAPRSLCLHAFLVFFRVNKVRSNGLVLTGVEPGLVCHVNTAYESNKL